MLNELENKIRKEIPELNKWEYGRGVVKLSIQLNHVLDYCEDSEDAMYIINNWNLKSNLLSDQSEELIKYLNEL